MSNLKMKSTKYFLHAVTDVTCVVGLHNFTNDESIWKFMITDNNKQLCYLDVINHALKNKLCECYNVIVDVPTTHLQLVNPDKSSHSKVNWNDKVNAVLAWSSFDSIIKILEHTTSITKLSL